jgi:serine/threonine-protein kinase
MGRVYIQLGNYEKAIEMLERGYSLAGDLPNVLGALGQALALAGRPAAARAMLDRLQTLARRTFVPSVTSAVIHLGLGDYEKALDCLETALRNRELAITVMKVHPLYDPLRGSPRFEALLREIGLSTG